MIKPSPLIGAVLAGALWGLSGTAAQALFETYNFPPVGLVSIRMLSGGLMLFAVIRPSFPKRNELLDLMLISILGIAASQVTYLGAIAFSNAPTGTLLQFLFLPIVAGYEALRGILKWSAKWTGTMILAIVGTVLLIGAFTQKGSFEILVTPIGVLSGIIAAITGAYYSLASRKVLRTKTAWWLVSWGFIIGGLATLPFGLVSFQGYSLPASRNALITILFLISFVIIFGTILAFGLYVRGLASLSATVTGVAASFEPISAALASFIFLGVTLTITQYVGGAFIILAVLLTASRQSQERKRAQLQTAES
ncbi:MAG: EamA family transporter [Nitrososphaerales archaeon]